MQQMEFVSSYFILFLFFWMRIFLLTSQKETKTVCSLSLRLLQLHKMSWMDSNLDASSERKAGGESTREIWSFLKRLYNCNEEMMATLKPLMGKSPTGEASNSSCGLGSLTCTPDTVRGYRKREALADGCVIDAVGWNCTLKPACFCQLVWSSAMDVGEGKKQPRLFSLEIANG